MPTIILLGTLDTKLQEFQYIYDQLTTTSNHSTGTPIKVILIDCGRSPVSDPRISVPQSDLVSRYGNDGTSPADLPRGQVIKHMISCTSRCVRDILQREPVHGIMSAGGSGGSSLAAAVMRDAIPLGMPKLLVSTVASGDTGPLVGETDLTLMPSVVDVAGNNELLKAVLGNAAAAMVGMAGAYEKRLSAKKEGADQALKIGVTMFGVTTPCVDRIRQRLEEKHGAEVFVFHATGTGGRAMERLVKDGALDAVIDVTTTELADHIAGGVMSAGPTRLEAALRAGIPYIVSTGATDMVNFGTRESVPSKYKDRQLVEHNPTVTLMRTNKGENAAIAAHIVDKIRDCAKDKSKVQVWVPKGGCSMLSVEGGPFEDRDADAALLDPLRKGLEEVGVELVEDDREVNKPGFADDVADAMMKLVKASAR